MNRELLTLGFIEKNYLEMKTYFMEKYNISAHFFISYIDESGNPRLKFDGIYREHMLNRIRNMYIYLENGNV